MKRIKKSVCTSEELCFIFNLKLSCFPHIEAYINEVQATSQALQRIKSGLDDEFIGILMLAGLTEEYNPLVMTLEHSGRKLTSEAAISALMKEGQRRQPAVEMDSVLVSNNEKPSSSMKKTVIFVKKMSF